MRKPSKEEGRRLWKQYAESQRRITSRTQESTRHLWSQLGCGALSLAVHVLLLSPMIAGWGRHQHSTPNQLGAPSNGQGAESANVLILTSMDDPDASEITQAPLQTSKLILTPNQLLAVSTKLDVEVPTPIQLSEQDDDSTSPDANAKGADDGTAALMFGRYMGQVTARIDRAWLRPRTPIDGGEFRCRVQIEQDRQGTVKEVTLKQCNGDTRWQLSLIRAIQSASPLPAPPDPAVFTSLMTIELDSAPFFPGRSSDGFEPEIGAAPRG